MAKRIITQLIDDISGESLPDGQGETIEFSVNNVSYSIDLGPENAREFHLALAPYIEKAERRGGTKRSSIGQGRRTSSSTRNDPAQLRAIREWARSAGYSVSDRGRIPRAIMEAYEDAHQS